MTDGESVATQRPVAVVTGGSSGIGFATAERLTADGFAVALWDRAPAPESPHLAIDVDVANGQAVRAAAEATRFALGPVRVLVNCAGVTFGYLPSESLDDRLWKRTLDVNLTGTMECTRAILPQMRAAGGGSIINLGSVLATYGFPGQTAYAASKAGIAGMTRTWARELGPHRIRVNLVTPGYIDTAMNAANGETLERMVVERTPLGRVGTPADVASAIAFLAGDAAAFITGAELAVDGGFIP